VFLDRDGTLIDTFVKDGVPTAARSLDSVQLLPGVRQALEQLRNAGFVLVLVTNQPDVARGALDRGVVEQIHARLLSELPLDDVECCYHDDTDNCDCRKPRPGMLIDSARRLGVTLQHSFAVGDRWRDIEAGKRAGCTTILLRRPYSGDTVRPDFEAADIGAAATIILRRQEQRK
jgi:D-glycero-D-manno-heptose 1,7-bisphosphate phosphatase